MQCSGSALIEGFTRLCLKKVLRGEGISVAFCPDADNLSGQVRSDEEADRRYVLRNVSATDDTNAACGVSLAAMWPNFYEVYRLVR